MKVLIGEYRKKSLPFSKKQLELLRNSAILEL